MIVTAEQRAHLHQNRALVAEHQLDPSIDIDEYIDHAEDDDEGAYSGYYYLCIDIGIDPLRPHPA